MALLINVPPIMANTHPEYKKVFNCKPIDRSTTHTKQRLLRGQLTFYLKFKKQGNTRNKILRVTI